MTHEVVFLHGLEARVDAHGDPQSGRASFLRDRFGAATLALDTRVAQEVARASFARSGTWRYPLDGCEEAFATPMARAQRLVAGPTRRGGVA